MKKFRKNNKGFSLVELIVVVLIIAIIAVALAPQVIKWVDQARKNTKENQVATVKSAVDTVVADLLGAGTTTDLTDITFTVSKAANATSVTYGGTNAPAANSDLQKALDIALADLKDGVVYTIKIDDNYTVKVTAP